jgi:hypothetical protein
MLAGFAPFDVVAVGHHGVGDVRDADQLTAGR